MEVSASRQRGKYLEKSYEASRANSFRYPGIDRARSLGTVSCNAVRYGYETLALCDVPGITNHEDFEASLSYEGCTYTWLAFTYATAL